jgi:hypothetical protein
MPGVAYHRVEHPRDRSGDHFELARGVTGSIPLPHRCRVVVRRLRSTAARAFRVVVSVDVEAVHIVGAVVGLGSPNADHLLIRPTTTRVGPHRFASTLSGPTGSPFGGCVAVPSRGFPAQATMRSRRDILEIRQAPDPSAAWIASAFDGELIWARADIAPIGGWVAVTVINGMEEKGPIDGWALAKFVRDV